MSLLVIGGCASVPFALLAYSRLSDPGSGPPAGGKFAKAENPIDAFVLAGIPGALLMVSALFLGTSFTSGVLIPAVVLVIGVVAIALRSLGCVDDQSPLSLLLVIWSYRNVDFPLFLKSHNAAFIEGGKTGNYVPGVCNYYELMGDLITMASGPFWHMVPMTKGLSRKQCHDKFHHTTVEYLDANKKDKILEFGCGFGEIGRQVAKISGGDVTGLTMADAEIIGGTERIKEAGLQDQCRLVQGNYHEMPFKANSFDKVFGIYTLKYSSDLEKFFSEAARVLKPGGRLLSYEIIITDKYDENNKVHKNHVYNISYSTCMPPLWQAKDFRAAAEKAGFVLKQETDLGAPATEEPWYSCFTQTGVHYLLKSSIITNLVQLAETLHIVPKSFTEFYTTCMVHPTSDFVDAGNLGIIDGSVMMVWEKGC